jgi:nicotinate-nucleotide adenylyltransferase
MRKIGVFGGSFDPVHCGHLIVAQDVFSALSLERVILVPAAVPPHKTGVRLSPAEHRLAMTRLVAAKDERFESSAAEIERGGVSYTVDTVRQMREHLGNDAAIFFIVGSDNLSEFPSWKEPEELLELCTVVTIARPGFRVETLPPVLRGKALPVQVTAVDISSRVIRERVRKGMPIRYLVPAEVESYIARHGLFREPSGA